MLQALQQLQNRGDFSQLGMPDLINQMAENGHAPSVQYISGHWMDINDFGDLARAGDFAHGRDS